MRKQQMSDQVRWTRFLDWGEKFAEKDPMQSQTECLLVLDNPALETAWNEPEWYWQRVRSILEKLPPEKSVKELKSQGFNIDIPKKNPQLKLFQELLWLILPPDT